MSGGGGRRDDGARDSRVGTPVRMYMGSVLDPHSPLRSTSPTPLRTDRQPPGSFDPLAYPQTNDHQPTVDQQIEADKRVLQQFAHLLRNFQLALHHQDGTEQTVQIYLEAALQLLRKANEDQEGLPTRLLEVDLTHLRGHLQNYITRHFYRLLDPLENELNDFIRELNQNLVLPRYSLKLINVNCKPKSVRELRGDLLSRLIKVSGQVTRSSDVLVELLYGAFTCRRCGVVTTHVKQEHKFTLPKRCSNERCQTTFEFDLMSEDCVFGDFQKIRIQESAQDAGVGAIPRSIEVLVRNSLVDQVYAGDEVVVSGCLIAVPTMPALLKRGEASKSMLKQMRTTENTVAQGVTGMKFIGVREIHHRLMFMANDVRKIEKDKSAMTEFHIEEGDIVEPEEVLRSLAWVSAIANRRDTIQQLAKLVAPRVYGAYEVKMGILLMLAGGVRKTTREGCKLRGDINICVVGDPSTGKSQLLKFVESFANRAIYTSGKGSTAAGLTAAVHRDPESGETVLEAGALMYADQGICCIDEFDKMDEKDRVAIHEAMEQQTISISKAGIQATLSARACILAGCNPRFGRYDKSRTFSQNVAIPAPLLSRFDLFFTTVDEIEPEKDLAVAQHIVNVFLEAADGRQDDEQPQQQQPLLSLSDFKSYIELAKHTKPLLTLAASEKLASTYVGLRTDEMLTSARSMRITVRQLEALIRLSEAVAKLKFSRTVEPEHVDIACDVFKASLHKVSNISPFKAKEGAAGTEDDQGDYAGSGLSHEEFVKAAERIVERARAFEMETGGLAQDQEIKEWYVDTFIAGESGTMADDLRRWWPRLGQILEYLIKEEIFISQASPIPGDDSLYVGVHRNHEPSFTSKTRKPFVPEPTAEEELEEEPDFEEFWGNEAEVAETTE